MYIIITVCIFHKTEQGGGDHCTAGRKKKKKTNFAFNVTF